METEEEKKNAANDIYDIYLKEVLIHSIKNQFKQTRVAIYTKHADDESQLIGGYLEIKESDESISKIVPWKDLLGAELSSSQNILTIYTFALISKRTIFIVKKKEKRTLQQLDLYSDNKEQLEQLLKMIIFFSRNDYQSLKELKELQKFQEKKPNVEKQGSETNILDQEKLPQQKAVNYKKKLLVFINPNSGKGEAMKNWTSCRNLLAKAGYEFNEVVSQYRFHTYDYIKDLPLETLMQYSGIVACAGDGTPHEILNGLYTRGDRNEALQIPVGVLHGGSGNALATSICDYSKEQNNFENAAFIIAKGLTRHIDVIEFERKNKNPIYSFLSLSWTYIADLDIGSEHLRFLGEQRFQLYGAWRLLFLRSYNANLAYSKEGFGDRRPSLSSFPQGENWKVIKGSFTFFLLCNIPFVSEKYKSAPLAKLDDGFMDLQILQAESGKWQMLKTAVSIESGNHVNTQEGSIKEGFQITYEKIKSIRLEPTSEQQGIYSIDGEQYPAEPIHGQVLHQIFKVYCF